MNHEADIADSRAGTIADTPDWNALPAALRERLSPARYAGLDAYVRHRRRPDGFLRAILENDVYALAQCQTPALLSLKAVVDALAYAPPACYGSRKAVADWLVEGNRR